MWKKGRNKLRGPSLTGRHEAASWSVRTETSALLSAGDVCDSVTMVLYEVRARS